MATTLTRPDGIPTEVIECTDKQLRALLATPYAPHATAEIAFREANAEAFAEAEAERRALEVADAVSLIETVFPGMSDTDLVILARLMKPAAPKANIVKDIVPESYKALRTAIFTVLGNKDINPYKVEFAPVTQ